MQPDASSIPHGWLQLAYLALATILSSAGTLIVDRLVKRHREPHEIEKLRAETKSIHVTAENAQVGVGLEILREIQVVTEKAEQRREEWYKREEQMRSQIVFWRNRAEELDGQLADSQEAIWKMESEVTAYEKQIKRMQRTMADKGINYDNSQDIPVGPTD